MSASEAGTSVSYTVEKAVHIARAKEERSWRAAFGQMGLEDFSLEVKVFEVIPHGPDAATVTTRWTERFTLALPPAGEGDAPEAGSATIEEVVDCTQVVQRNAERLQMGLMTCTGDMRF